MVSVVAVRLKSCASRTRTRALGLDPDSHHRRGSAVPFKDKRVG